MWGERDGRCSHNDAKYLASAPERHGRGVEKECYVTFITDNWPFVNNIAPVESVLPCCFFPHMEAQKKVEQSYHV